MMRLDHLPNSEPQEEVRLFLRRHWIDLVKVFVFSGLLLLVPVAILTLFTYSDIEVFQNPIWGPFALLTLSAYLLIVLIITATEITDYWLDVWIVTNERVISIEQLGLFKRVLSEVHLDQIQDVTSETKGILATFLTYGDVYIQTAATRERFQFKNIDNPDQVKIKVSELANVCQVSHTHGHEHKKAGPHTIDL